MKKLALILAMLLCLVPVLSACGANSSPEKAVSAALDVKYGDGDADPEDYYAVVLNYNLDVLDLMDDEDAAKSYKESIRESQKSIKDSLNSMEDMDENAEDQDIDDWSFEYEIAYCNIYDKGSDTFDSYVESFIYANSSVEDSIEEVAIVGVLEYYEYSKDDCDYTNIESDSYVCYCIDGDWYVVD